MLTKDTVFKVAQLARLELTDNEAEEYRKQFQDILNYFDKINDVDTKGVEPLVTPTPIEFFMREDVVKQDVSVEEIMKNAPETQGNLFKVPPVVGG